MTGKNGIQELLAAMCLYIEGVVSGREFVKKVDVMVSNGNIKFSSKASTIAFNELHNEMALCVWDKQTYKDSAGVYISDLELKVKVNNFIRNNGKELCQFVF